MAIATGVETTPYKYRMFDKLLEIRDNTEGAETGVSADRATLTHEFPFVSSAVAPIDLGLGRFVGKMIIQVLSIDVATGDEIYNFIVFGQNDALSKKVPLGELTIGAAAALPGTEAGAVKEYEIHFENDVEGEVFPQITLGLLSFGATARSIDYQAFITRVS